MFQQLLSGGLVSFLQSVLQFLFRLLTTFRGLPG